MNNNIIQVSYNSFNDFLFISLKILNKVGRMVAYGTNFMKQTPSASQDTPSLLMNPNISPCSQEPVNGFNLHQWI
jgi:hypothetical protein